jgi:predicted metalloprotease
MLWQGRRESENVEDARGAGGGRLVLGGGIGTVILVVLYLLLGGDPQALFNSQQAQLPQSAQFDNQAPRDGASKFVAVVLADTEDAWHENFRQMGRQYEEPGLVLFTDLIQSGCGFASGATGPFYCPQDRRVYIDLGFFRQLQERLGAGGDFAEAYVIAHEVGHHVQNLLGINDRVQAARGRVSQSEYNQLSRRGVSIRFRINPGTRAEDSDPLDALILIFFWRRRALSKASGPCPIQAWRCVLLRLNHVLQRSD